MSLSNKNIDFKQLKRYFDGSLSESEKNILERAAMDDPFLKDAMDGFANDPSSLAEFEKNYVKKNPFKRKKNIAIRSITILGVLSTIYIITIVIFPKEIEQHVDILSPTATDSIITIEVEVLPSEIESLDIVTDFELITNDEIVENKVKIQEEVNYDTSMVNEKIVIDENEPFDVDFKIVDEKGELKKPELVPATYLFDLFIVDYRRIKRDRDMISYTRYELSGTSAELEDENSQNELMEKKVDVPYFEYLRTSMEYFKDGYYKKALNRYKTILEQYSEDANALFYGGLCYYNMKKYSKSLEFFNTIEDIELYAFKEEAKWYKSKCLIKLGLIDEARNVLDEIIIKGGFYSEDAMKVRKGL